VPDTDVVRPQRARFAMGDMARSLGLLIVVIAALLFIGPARSLILPGSKDRMAPIDYSGYVTGFNTVSSAPAVVPAGLPSSWRANAGSLNHNSTSAHLHVGWAVPGTAFAGLDEGTGSSDALLRLVTGAASLQSRGTTTIAGDAWTVRRSSRGETAYTRDVNRVLVIITGNATDTQLRLLAASLH
jgi:hypothetical protein